MDKEIQIIAKKYNLDSQHEKKLSSFSQVPLDPIKEERISHKSFHITSPPTLLHKRLEDRIKFLEIENQKLYKKISELNDKNKKLDSELSQLKDTTEEYSFRKNYNEELENKSKQLEQLEESSSFLQSQLDFLIQNHEEELEIKDHELMILKQKISYYSNLPSIENLSVLKDNLHKLYKDNEIMKINTKIQEEIIQKLKSELSLASLEESQEVQALTQRVKKLEKSLELEKASNKKLCESNLALSSSLTTLQYELELEKSRSSRFHYTPLLSSPCPNP